MGVGQVPLLLEFVSIWIVSLVGLVPLRIWVVVVAGDVPAVSRESDVVPPVGSTSREDSMAIVVSDVVAFRLVVLPPSVEESLPSALSSIPSPLVSVMPVSGVPSGQDNPHMASESALVEDPVLGVPSQAARANADKTKSETDPIRMIFPTTKITHR